MKKLLLATTLLAACGGNQEQNRGDQSRELAEVWCDSLAACKLIPDVDYCVEHNVWHLCTELTDTCDEPSNIDLEQCFTDIAARTCDEVYFGIVPLSCNPFWEALDE